MANPRVERDGRAKNEGGFAKPSTYVLDLKNARVKGVAGRLRFAKPSMQVLGLANPRVERVHPQRMRAATLRFAKPSTCVLDLANARWAYKG